MVTVFPMTEQTYKELCDNYGGACLACGQLVHEGIEPDARGYKCPHCGMHQVYGAEELMIEEKIDFIEV
jgi:predicted RNA-binding Zn-ribbon protein involved in translation (DUF1610 family)